MRTPTTTLVGAAWRGWTLLATSVSVLTFLILAADMASAQVEVTVGASIGRGCKSGFEPCGGPLVGAQGGIWAHEHIGLRLRFTSLRSDDLRSEKGDFTLVRANRTRLLVTGEFLYRFLVENSVQPIVGFAVGGRRERQTIRCEGISCAAAEAVLGTEFPRGEFPFVPSTGVLGGVMVKPASRLTIEALIGLHDYPTEHGATAEATLLVGVGLWRSRATR